MIPMQLMIGQLTGEPNPFAHHSQPRRILADREDDVFVNDELTGNARRSESRILTTMARIRQWEGASYTEGFSTCEVERNCGCGARIAREAVGRMLASGELVKLKTNRQGAPLFRKANYGQIDRAA